MKTWKNILFWGAAWGILEVTLGWGLHLIHFKGEAMVLYPFGLACMLTAVRQCGGEASTTLKVAGVAALIKLVNLFTWPGVPAYYVVNPAIAIFLEGAVTYAYYRLMIQQPKMMAYPGGKLWMAFVLILASFFAFKGWQIMMDGLTTYNPNAHTFLGSGMLWTWLWRSVVQGVMLVAIAGLIRKWQPSEGWQMRTASWSLPMLIVSLFATFYL